MMPTSKRVRKNLEWFLRETDESLYGRFTDLRRKSLDHLAARQQVRDDTGAAGFHYKSVHLLSDRLLPYDKLQNLAAIEVYALLAAVYLHDVGKLRPEGERTTHHATDGMLAILEHDMDLGFSEPEAIAVGCIVEAHGPKPIGDLPAIRGIHPYGEVRVQYLGALLRLADDLDMCFTRAPGVARKLVAPEPNIAGKWDLRSCVDNVAVSPGSWTIEVQATPHSPVEHSRLLRELESINARLAESREFLRATPEIGLYYKILEIRIDGRFIGGSGDAGAASEELSRAQDRCKCEVMPANTAVVVVRQDPVSLADYAEVVAPLLREEGYSPLLVEEVASTGPLIERTLRVLEGGSLVLADISEDGSPSVYFRLGAAIGKGKRVVIYSRKGTGVVGDLSGLEVLHYQDRADLQKKLRDMVRPSPARG